MYRFLLFIFLLPYYSVSQEVTIETESASVAFDYISEKTTGEIQSVSAKLHLNDENLSNSSISGSAPVILLDTGNKMRDKHLKSDDFFNVENHPKMTFASSAISKEGNVYVAKGTLTIKGISKDVVFNVAKSGVNYECTATIYALDYDVAIKKKNREKSKVTIVVTIPI